MSSEQQSAVSDYGFDFDAVAATDRYTGVAHEADGEVIHKAVKAEKQYAT